MRTSTSQTLLQSWPWPSIKLRKTQNEQNYRWFSSYIPGTDLTLPNSRKAKKKPTLLKKRANGAKPCKVVTLFFSIVKSLWNHSVFASNRQIEGFVTKIEAHLALTNKIPNSFETTQSSWTLRWNCMKCSQSGGKLMQYCKLLPFIFSDHSIRSNPSRSGAEKDACEGEWMG